MSSNTQNENTTTSSYNKQMTYYKNIDSINVSAIRSSKHRLYYLKYWKCK